MAFYLGAVQVTPVPTSDANSRGSKLISNGSDGTNWGYMGSGFTGFTPDNAQWRYRSIFTHGYLAGGYKGSTPWRSVNKTWHQTDTTVYCGEQLSNYCAYTNGFWSDYHAYICSTNGYSNSHDQICSYSLANGSIRMFTADGFSSSGISYGYVGNDPKNQGLGYGTAGFGNHVGGMKMDVSRVDAAATEDMKGQSGWITGGGPSSTNRMHFPTEVMYTGWGSNYGGRGDAVGGELRGYFNHNGNEYQYVTWANATWTANWDQGGYYGKTSYQTKNLGSKYGYHYAFSGNNVTSGIAKFNDANGATLSTFNKVRAYGEENSEEGQDWGYIMGHYDGQQNNHTVKQSYTSDSQITLGANAMPKGHYGQSSGACSTGAATVIAGSGF